MKAVIQRTIENIKKLRRFSLAIKQVLTLLGLILLGIILYISWPDIVASITANPMLFLTLIVLNYLIYWLQSTAFCLLMDPKRSFKGIFSIWGISNLLNYVTAFHAGLLLRGQYFAKHGFSVKEIALKTSFLMGINLSLAAILLAASTLTPTTFLILITISVCTLFLLNRTIKNPSTQKIKSQLSNFKKYFSFKIFLIAITYNLLLIASIHIVLPHFGIPLDLKTSTQIASSLSLSSVISLMPNNLGVQEGVFILFTHNQLNTQDAISASAFFRAASISAGLSLLFYKSIYFIKKQII